MARKSFIFLFFLLFIIGCSQPKTTWSSIQHDDLPGAVAVVKFRSNDSIWPKCSGTLVKPNAVLTAAHCVDDLEVKEVGIVFNCRDISSSSCIAAKAHAIAYKLDIDIALIVLDSNLIEFQNQENDDFPSIMGIRTAGLCKESPQDGQPLIVAGFGTQGKLKAGMAFVYDEGFNLFVTDYTNMDRPEPGDSGGPAYSIHGNDLEIVGLTSRYLMVKDEDGNYKFQGIVHTNVANHIEWIEENYAILDTNIKLI